jgi:hypothetical protein
MTQSLFTRTANCFKQNSSSNSWLFYLRVSYSAEGKDLLDTRWGFKSHCMLHRRYCFCCSLVFTHELTTWREPPHSSVSERTLRAASKPPPSLFPISPLATFHFAPIQSASSLPERLQARDGCGMSGVKTPGAPMLSSTRVILTWDKNFSRMSNFYLYCFEICFMLRDLRFSQRWLWRLRWFLARLSLRLWRWRRYVPPKRRLTFNRLDGVISKKTFLLFYFMLVEATERYEMQLCRAGSRSGNAVDSYPGGTRFESRFGHLISCPRCVMVFLSS